MGVSISSMGETFTRTLSPRTRRALFHSSLFIDARQQYAGREVTTMTDYLSILPAELFPKIFDDLLVDDILASLCFVNKRLRALCLSYPRFRFDLDSCGRKKKRQVQSICAHLPYVSSQILSLKFSKECGNLKFMKISRFFSQTVDIADAFPKLRSITIGSIDEQTWRSINPQLTTLVSLVSLSIDCHERVNGSTVSQLLCELLCDCRTLKRLHVKVFVDGTDAFVVDPRPETRRSQIEHLSLDGCGVELRSLFAVTPALQSLTVSLALFQFRTDTRFYSPETIRHLKIHAYFIELTEIETMLHSLEQLTDLTVITTSVQHDMADGWTWSRLLKSISTFKFVLTFKKSIFTPPAIDLTSFRTPFWLEEKHWYVTYERCRDSDFSMLYSNPYCHDEYPLSYMRDQLTVESTAVDATLFPAPTIIMADSPFHSAFQLRSSLSRITRESLADYGTSLRSKLDYAMEYLHLARITSFTALRCETDLPPDVFVKFLQGLPRLTSLNVSMYLLKRLLISEWPGIRSLRLWANVPVQSDPLSLCQTDAFCRSFRRVDWLSMSIAVLPDLSLVLNNIRKMPILAHLSIFPFNRLCERGSEKIIDRDWLKTNTQLRHFDYSRCDTGIGQTLLVIICKTLICS